MAMFSLVHASRLGRVSILLATCGLILAIIAVATPYWRASDILHMGLWETCEKSICRRLYTSDTLKARLSDGVDGWFQCVEVLETIGMTFSLGAVIVIGLYACVPDVSSPTVAGWGVVTSVVSGVTILVGTVIYSQKTSSIHALDLSWSFALAIVSGCLQCLAGFLLILTVRQKRRVDDM
ncbi:claudin domain-containing protein 2-like [Liolophura sinensis]|uniref:claudin domain-containing protein 2-like n=1 Tax=Liolophura sinensis TaxID=3198878 RepID=UPI0031581581